METEDGIELIDPSENKSNERGSFEDNFYKFVGSINTYIENEFTPTIQEGEHKFIPRTFMSPPLSKFMVF